MPGHEGRAAPPPWMRVEEQGWDDRARGRGRGFPGDEAGRGRGFPGPEAGRGRGYPPHERGPPGRDPWDRDGHGAQDYGYNMKLITVSLLLS